MSYNQTYRGNSVRPPGQGQPQHNYSQAVQIPAGKLVRGSTHRLPHGQAAAMAAASPPAPSPGVVMVNAFQHSPHGAGQYAATPHVIVPRGQHPQQFVPQMMPGYNPPMMMQGAPSTQFQFSGQAPIRGGPMQAPPPQQQQHGQKVHASGHNHVHRAPATGQAGHPHIGAQSGHQPPMPPQQQQQQPSQQQQSTSSGDAATSASPASTTASKAPRRSNKIKLVDPNSGKDITEEVFRPSTKATVPVQPTGVQSSMPAHAYPPSMRNMYSQQQQQQQPPSLQPVGCVPSTDGQQAPVAADTNSAKSSEESSTSTADAAMATGTDSTAKSSTEPATDVSNALNEAAVDAPGSLEGTPCPVAATAAATAILNTTTTADVKPSSSEESQAASADGASIADATSGDSATGASESGSAAASPETSSKRSEPPVTTGAATSDAITFEERKSLASPPDSPSSYKGKRSQSPDLKKSESADSESAFLDEPAAVPKRKYKTVVKSVVYNDPKMWTPENPEGKKNYSRDFLMQFSKVSEMPASLAQHTDIVIRSQSHAGGRSNSNFLPTFIPSSGPTDRSSGSGRPRRERDRRASGSVSSSSAKKTVVLHMDAKVEPLVKGENRWEPARERGATGNSEEALVAKFRVVMNKLTPEKFDKLAGEVDKLPIETETQLRSCIDIVFLKALHEPIFSESYARMCNRIAKIKVPMDKGEDTISFRKVLLTRCQREFEDTKDSAIEKLKKKYLGEHLNLSPDALKAAQDEYDMQVIQLKKRSLGNIRFIGELYKFNMLTESILHDCIIKLLMAADEESLELMCKLLSTTGFKLDHDKAKSRFDQYYEKIDRILDKGKVSSRIRFMLRDLMDLKENNWKPRRDEGPKTLSEVHRDAQAQAQRTAAAAAAAPPPSRGSRGQQGPASRSSHFWRSDTTTKPSPRRPRNHSRHRGKPQAAAAMQRGPINQQDFWRSNTTTERGPRRPRNHSRHRGKPQAAAAMQHGAINQQGRGNQPQGRGSQNNDDGWQQAPSRQRADPDKLKGVSQRVAMSQGRDESVSLGPSSRTAWGQGAKGGVATSSSASRDAGNRYASLFLSDPIRSPERVNGGIPPATSGGPTGRKAVSQGASSSMRSGSRDKMQGPTASAAQRDRESALRSVTASLGATSAASSSVTRQSGVSDEEVEKKAQSLTDEFLGIRDTKEAIQCLKDLGSRSPMHVAVRTMMTRVLDKKEQDNVVIGELLAEVPKDVLSVDHIIEGISLAFEEVPDLELDSPRIYDNLAMLLRPLVLHRDVRLRHIADACVKQLMDYGKPDAVMAKLMTAIASAKGEGYAQHLWLADSLNWSTFLRKGVDVAQFLADKNLTYTSTDTMRQLVETDASVDEFMRHISETMGEVNSVEAVMELTKRLAESHLTVVDGQVTVFESEKSKQLTKLLENGLDMYYKTPEYQLAACQALEQVSARHDHPSGLLETLFSCYYDCSTVEDEVFYKWESEVKSKSDGKLHGVALMGTKHFFEFIRNPEGHDV